MPRYTIEEKKDMFFWNVEDGHSLQRVSDLFSVKYPNRPIPDKSTVQRVTQLCRRTGGVFKQRPSTPTLRLNQMSEEKELMVLAAIENDSNKSVREIANEVNMSHTFVHNILRAHRYKSFRYSTSQETSDDSKFCEIENANVTQPIEESTFALARRPNLPFRRYWSLQNEQRVVISSSIPEGNQPSTSNKDGFTPSDGLFGAEQFIKQEMVNDEVEENEYRISDLESYVDEDKMLKCENAFLFQVKEIKQEEEEISIKEEILHLQDDLFEKQIEYEDCDESFLQQNQIEEHLLISKDKQLDCEQ